MTRPPATIEPDADAAQAGRLASELDAEIVVVSAHVQRIENLLARLHYRASRTKLVASLHVYQNQLAALNRMRTRLRQRFDV